MQILWTCIATGAYLGSNPVLVIAAKANRFHGIFVRHCSKRGNGIEVWKFPKCCKCVQVVAVDCMHMAMVLRPKLKRNTIQKRLQPGTRFQCFTFVDIRVQQFQIGRQFGIQIGENVEFIRWQWTGHQNRAYSAAISPQKCITSRWESSGCYQFEMISVKWKVLRRDIAQKSPDINSKTSTGIIFCYYFAMKLLEPLYFNSNIWIIVIVLF